MKHLKFYSNYLAVVILLLIVQGLAKGQRPGGDNNRIEPVPEQSVCDGQTINIPLTFVLVPGNSPDNYVLSATDNNPNINPTYSFGGTGLNRTLIVSTKPGELGRIAIRVSAAGGGRNRIGDVTIFLNIGKKNLSYFVGNEMNVIPEENGIRGFAIAPDGKIYVSVAGGVNKIREYSSTGTLLNADYITGLTRPGFLFIDRQGKLYLIDDDQIIRKYNGQALERSLTIQEGSITSLTVNSVGEIFLVSSQNPNSRGRMLKIPANFTDGPPTIGSEFLFLTSFGQSSVALSPDEETLFFNGGSSSGAFIGKVDGRIISPENGSIDQWRLQIVTVREVVSGPGGVIWIRHEFNGEKLSWTPAVQGDPANLTKLNDVIESNFLLTSMKFDSDANVYGMRGSGESQGIYKYNLTLNPTFNPNSDFISCVTPTLSSIENQTTCVGQSISNIPITLDGDTQATLSASSSNSALSPTITFGGSGANRTMTIVPTVGESGTTTITVTATGSDITTSTSFTLNINSTPAAPTSTAQSFCGEATIANLVATGSNLKWYADNTTTSALASSAFLSTGTYYVSQTVNGCESSRTAVTVTLNSTTSAPTATAQSFCGEATVGDLVASGSNIKWYTAETGGSALETVVSVKTGTYYASQTVNGCESSRTSVAVTLNSTPAAPTATAQGFCGEATVGDLVATGSI